MPQPDAPTQAADPLASVHISDRYEVGELIARGGMAAVYAARHIDLDRPVALKVLDPPQGHDHVDFETRFRIEARALAALHHPHIVTIYDFGVTDEGALYLAMALVPGERFTDVIRVGRLPPHRAAHLLLQAGLALRYAHQQGVVHRDLKPSNLLVHPLEDGTEHLTVVDFGLARLVSATEADEGEDAVLGSPHCMSPEQIRGHAADGRTDIYALGVLLFRAITGTYPFHGATPAQTMTAHLHAPLPALEAVAPDVQVPEGLEAVIQRCLAKDPDDRYADMGAMLAELAAAVDVPLDPMQSASISVAAIHRAQHLAAVKQTPPPTAHRSLAPLLLAAVLLGALGLGLGYGVIQAVQATATTQVSEPVPAVPAPAAPVARPAPPQPAVPPPAPAAAPVPEAVPAEGATEVEAPAKETPAPVKQAPAPVKQAPAPVKQAPAAAKEVPVPRVTPTPALRPPPAPAPAPAPQAAPPKDAWGPAPTQATPPPPKPEEPPAESQGYKGLPEDF